MVVINSKKIKILENPSVDEFRRESDFGDRPVLIRGAMKGWGALGAWSPAFFTERYGSHSMKVACSSDGVFRGDPDVGFERAFETMTLEDFFDRGARRHGNRSYYLQQTNLSEQMPDLEHDLECPNFIGPVKLQSVNLWMGFAGNVTPLHFDVSHNILAQVTGTKKVRLYSPVNSGFLYPYPAQSRIPHMSMADPDAPDLIRFPLLSKAKCFETELCEGEMLFIPFSWWHKVSSLSFCISVNFWWKPDFLR